MHIDVCLSFRDLRQDDIKNRTVLVIDSLGTATSIITALSLGAKRVIPVKTVGEALQRKETTERHILIGERYGKRINGFHYGNSPSQLGKELIDQTVIITTTYGTKVFQKLKKASHVLIGCFTNAHYAVQHAYLYKKDISLVCVGRQGKFSIEDGLTAGLMIRELEQITNKLELSDTALLLKQSLPSKLEDCYLLVKQGEAGRRLLLTSPRDILHCLQWNTTPIVGVYEQGEIIPILCSGHIGA